jgi:hypothetical protein
MHFFILQVRSQTDLQACAYRRVPGLCDAWPAGIPQLPGDRGGGHLDFRFGSRLAEAAALNTSRPADGPALLVRLGNMTRVYVDAGGCVDGYQGRMCAECSAGYYRASEGACLACPAWGNFITYMAWFAVWAAAVVGLAYAGTSRVHAHFMLLGLAQV